MTDVQNRWRPADFSTAGGHHGDGGTGCRSACSSAPCGRGWPPPIKGAVALTHSGERLHEYLGSEADHFFRVRIPDAGAAECRCRGGQPYLAWQWRPHRGPKMVTGLCTGVVIAAGAAVGVGVLLVHLRYGTPDFAAAPVEPRPPAVLRH